MQKYSASEIINFLKAMDEFLSAKVEIIIIGGTAAALAYKASRRTSDVDTYNAVDGLQKAHAAAQKKLGVKIPLGQSTVADAPYNFAGRLEEVDLGLNNLVVKVPEVHDLILMKTMRAYDHDQEVIKQIVDEDDNEVDLEILVERFKSEMTHVTGYPGRIRGNFLAVVETAFGEKAAEKVFKELES